MNTTHTTPSEFLPGKFVAAKISAGDLYMHSSGVKRVTRVQHFEDGYVAIHWDGGQTMCEPDTVLRYVETK